MSKDELRILARITLIAVGLYVLLQTFLTVFSALPSIIFISPSTDIKNSSILISFTMYIVMALAAVYFLIRSSNRISAKITEAETNDESQTSWLAVAFRLICVTAGIFFLYWTLPRFSIIIFRYYMNYHSENNGLTTYFTNESTMEYLVMLLISIYLAFGAPGFVRWQVKKTLQQCNKTIEQQKF